MFAIENVTKDGKYECPDCGSIYRMEVGPHNRHIKTLKHLKAIGKEDDFDGEENKLYSQQFRAKKREELGDDDYKKMEAQDRKERRRKEKAKTTEKATEKMVEMTQFEKIVELLQNNQPNLQKKTIEINLKNIGIIYKILNNEKFDYGNINWLNENPKNISANVITHYKQKGSSIKTMSNILASASSVLKGLNQTQYNEAIDIYSKVSTEIQNIVNKELETGELSEKQKDWFNWTEIKELEQYVDENAEPLDYGLYHIYTDIAPRRILDYVLMKVATEEEEKDKELSKDFNWLIIDKYLEPVKMIINKYKTPAQKKWAKENKNDGSYTLTLPKKLQDSLDEYMVNADIKAGDYLFNKKGKPYTESEFSKLVSNMLDLFTDNKMTLNSLRHAYVSYYLPKAKNQKERKKLAFDMGSSVETLQSNYDKFELR